MEEQLLIVAKAMSDETKKNQLSLMADALTGGPHGGGSEELVRFFGKHLEGVKKLTGHVTTALDEMIPGVKGWMEQSGYSDDKFMMLALIEMGNSLAKMGAPADARKRPNAVPLPKHL